MQGWFGSLIRVFFGTKSSFKFAIGAVLGMAFSMMVILSTVGIMDGFQDTLRKELKSAEGDLYFTHKDSFFYLDKTIKSALANLEVQQFALVVLAQGFLITAQGSQGVELKGIDAEDWENITGVGLNLSPKEAAIGFELAQKFALKVGDKITVVYAGKGTDSMGVSPIADFKVGQIVEHGIYQKDLRQIYLPLNELQHSLGVGERINMIALNLPAQAKSKDSWKSIRHFMIRLGDSLGMDYIIYPYWNEYAVLFSAVEEQKSAIVIMLVLIILVSAFNIMAFISFLSEKCSREIFLFRALGVGNWRLTGAWVGVVVGLWGVSSLLSFVMVKIFDQALNSFDFLVLPASIYHLGKLNIELGILHYVAVSFSVLLLLLLCVSVLIKLKERRSILHNLRREFA